MLRTFVALTLESATLDQLVRLQHHLRDRLGFDATHWRALQPEQMHVTVAFLGATDPERIPNVSAIVEQVAERHVAFALDTGSLLYLPKPQRVQVVALGLEDLQGRAATLATDLESSLTPLGLAFAQRRFLAHITLMRSRKPCHIPPLDLVARAPLPDQSECRFSQLAYYASFLQALGARYELLSSISLGTRAS